MTQLAGIDERPARGPLVFHLEYGLCSIEHARYKEAKKTAGRSRVPMGIFAPTLNEYHGLKSWEIASVKKQIGKQIAQAMATYHSWNMGVRESVKLVKGKVRRERSGGRRRIVVVTRYSLRRPDEIAADSIGGKMPIDRLVAAGVLRGDSDKWCERIARWEHAPAGTGRVVVEVFEEVRS